MTNLINLNSNNYIGVRYWVGFGPQYNMEFHDQEPSGPQSGAQETVIKGAVTGVPKLGAAMYLAFVGEEVDARWFDATDAPSDWGDGAGAGGFTHTYNRPGGYWVTVGGGGGALSARFCRVIYKTRPAPNSGTNYTALDISYPVKIEPNGQGDITGVFAFQGTVRFDVSDFKNQDLGYIVERSIFGVFCQEYRGGQPYGGLKIVAGGWLTNRSFDEQPGARYLKFTAYGPSFWMLNAPMREMTFIDPGIMGSALAANANASSQPGGNPLTDDLFGQGYVPNHWIKCDCTIAALHIVQHMRVYASTGDDPTSVYSPVMAQSWGTASYGNPGQFWDITTDQDVDEAAGKTIAGFTDFNLAAGMMLSSIRQMVENEGFRYYDLGNLTQRFERKPFYRATQPDPVLTLSNSDLKLLMSGREPFQTTSGTQKTVRQVQVEKPMLSTLSDASDTSADDSGYGLSLRDPANMVSTMPVPPGAAFTGAMGDLWKKAVTNNQFGSSNITDDPLNVSVEDINQFYARWPDPARSFGQTIGPLQNVFSLDPLAYAKGRDKEERAHWGEHLPLGQVIGIELGQVVAISYDNPMLGINWEGKLFEVVRRNFELNAGGSYYAGVDIFEINPDDGLVTGSGGNSTDPFPVPVSQPTNLEVHGVDFHSANFNWELDGTQGLGEVYDLYINGQFWTTFGANSGTVMNLAHSTAYSAYVKARSTSGTQSNPTNSVSFTTPAS